MNRGRWFAHAILLMMCVMITLPCISAEETPCEHSFTQIEIPGDCLNPGMRYKECTKCGEQIDFQNTPALGHDYGEWVTDTPAKCTENGVKIRTCSRCGRWEEQTIPAAGHQYEDEVHEPTCTKRGSVYAVCQVCGDRKSKGELPPLGHCYDEGVVTKEPTERAMGVRTFTCERCGATHTERIPRLEKEDKDTSGAAGKHSSAKNHGRHKKYSSKKKKQRKAYYEDALRWAEQNGISTGDTAGLSPDSVCTRAQAVLSLWRASGAPEPKGTSCAFEDVSDTDAYYQAVLWAVENGITAGVDDTHFGPDRSCTRAQIVTFLYKADGSPECRKAERYKDVAPDDYFYRPVLWALQRKITSGVCRYHFGSHLGCTWGQLATFLYRIYR